MDHLRGCCEVDCCGKGMAKPTSLEGIVPDLNSSDETAVQYGQRVWLLAETKKSTVEPKKEYIYSIFLFLLFQRRTFSFSILKLLLFIGVSP